LVHLSSSRMNTKSLRCPSSKILFLSSGMSGTQWRTLSLHFHPLCISSNYSCTASKNSRVSSHRAMHRFILNIDRFMILLDCLHWCISNMHRFILELWQTWILLDLKLILHEVIHNFFCSMFFFFFCVFYVVHWQMRSSGKLTSSQNGFACIPLLLILNLIKWTILYAYNNHFLPVIFLCRYFSFTPLHIL
jgi:hypothetical protein